MTINPITPNAPLANPSHANQHLTVNGQVANLISKVDDLTAGALAAATSITQARRTTHEWVVRGPLVKSDGLLLPILWNLTSQTVQYEAAKMTVYTPPVGASILVDLVAGDFIASGQYDSEIMESVLSAQLEIMDGDYESPFYYGASMQGDAFNTDMAPQTFLAAYITNVGSTTPGADLTIQLNRLL